MKSSKDKAPAIDKLYRLFSGCSTRCLFRIAGWLAWLISHSRNRLSWHAGANVRLCFPHLNKSQQQQLAQQSVHHACCAFLELSALWYQPIDKVLGLITRQDVEESFWGTNKAKIIVAPHQGSWELLNLWLASVVPLISLYKPAKSSKLDPLIMSKRTRNGASLVPVNTAGLRALLKGLKSGASVMILPDQKPSEQSARIDAPFYGYPASTSLLVKNLASKVDCEIYIAAATRNVVSGTYQLKVERLDREQVVTDDLMSATYLNHAIETFVGPDVAQYQWTYRRYPMSLYQQMKAD